ncbi:uncharacterized protein Z520_05217 [Fonsecaea multimorphosa CBS 102226]|uniref:Kynurenine formamidase n=1 Tax=Fonsecaea multimorphosa CBS 102226 TaxID=1442371 RepID=A0A0D2IP25_9EURO|nr:uncharacterized protein Z520_05217 [Fonsecaea multimorphosa CBS 102226]KIX98756.1 hypothetical protein Z520_05217 [Fonsecaea multimorphosa CBS 102226]OAL25038.1 hypothetical protein AYO22_04915 [Fonsecaea multimorphosa]
MKKVIRYLQDQALEASQQKYSGAAYLSPATKEPQQRVRHHSPSYYKEQHNSHHQSRSAHPSLAAHSFPAHTTAGTEIPRSSGQEGRASPHISERIHRDITRHQYAPDNILQSYELYVPELNHSHLADPSGNKYWIVFIHGGYFRDPTVTSSSFYPALDQLVSGKGNDHHHHHNPFKHDENVPAVAPYIAGYASLNYRLSPHPEKAPQDPSKTPTYELRNAKWPDHIHDILTAIAHLQNRYGFGERYLLAGHSVGATMAVLSTIAAHRSFSKGNPSELPKIQPPMAVLGVSGIYDFPLLHESFADYIGMTRNAIPDAADDVLASPARYDVRDYVEARAATGEKKRALVIAHSKDDGWVDWKQVEAMEKVFAASGSVIKCKVCELKGQHNDIWEKGTELARAIAQTVDIMRGLDGDGQ